MADIIEQRAKNGLHEDREWRLAAAQSLSLDSWKPDPIDEKHQHCHANAVNGKDIENCHKQAAGDWQQALDSVFSETMKGKTKDQQNALQGAQDSWEKFRSSQLESTRDISGDGSFPLAFDKAELTRARVKFLRGENSERNIGIDAPLNECFENAQSSGERAACVKEESDKWNNKEMESYLRLMSELNPDQKLSLRRAQTDWMNYTYEQLRASKMLLPPNGQQSETALSRELMTLTRNRAIYLDNKIRYEGD